ARTTKPNEEDVDLDVGKIRSRLALDALYLLDTPGDLHERYPGKYPSPSEADMACVSKLAGSALTEREIWSVLRASARYRDRVSRKGRRHAEELFEKELAKAESANPRRYDTPDAAEYVGGD